MSNKKYYWLKLKENFFDDDTMQFIEEQENGIFYSNFYMKLCLKSLKHDGKLIRLVGETLIPYDVKSLSKLTGVPSDTVAVAMQLFEKIGLIKVLDSGEIYLSQMGEMIGFESNKAESMRLLRAKKKLEGNNVTNLLPKRYTEIEKEIEKEIEIEKEKQSISHFISKLESQFEKAIPRNIQDKIKIYSKQYKVNPLEIYEKSDYLRGLTNIKPTLAMFGKEQTYENMSIGMYTKNFSKEKEVREDNELTTQLYEELGI